MKISNFYKFFVLIILLISISTYDLLAQKKPLRRADSFFGLHFDFHALENDSLVGKTLNEAMIDSLLQEVKPDFIQIDSKGHPGVTSFPTKNLNGTHVKSFDKDPMALFRKVTTKHGVALYAHYSGVWDDAALKKKPYWGVVNEKGELSKQKISVHGNYSDSLLIPQLKEIADYGLNGAWVDGDCWATLPDYTEKALKIFASETGFANIPKSMQDAHYQDFRDFSRQSFKRYVGHYTDELHKYKPTFQVASNWAFSSFMPYPVDLNVDFMSGDFFGVNSALFESRVLATQSQYYKKPWDLMSWGFNFNWGSGLTGLKSVVNLSQEAAEIMAMGGGFQCYFAQNRDASIRLFEVPTMAKLAQFVRARQRFCQNTTPIPQIGLLYSLVNFQRINPSLFGNSESKSIQGTLLALMDGQHPTEILSEHHLTKNMNKYPLIIIPETQFLEDSFVKELLIYVENGGNLLVIGSQTAQIFKKELGIEFTDKASKQNVWVEINHKLGGLRDSVATVKVITGQIISRMFKIPDLKFPEGVSASINNYGKGKIGGIYVDLGKNYQLFKSPELRDYLSNMVNQLFKNPKLTSTGSHLVHLTLNTLNEKMMINLINSGGQHDDPNVFTYDELPPVHNITLKINTDRKPQKIVQQPENIKLDFIYQNGITTVQIPKLEIQSIVEVAF